MHNSGCNQVCSLSSLNNWFCWLFLCFWFFIFYCWSCWSWCLNNTYWFLFCFFFRLCCFRKRLRIFCSFSPCRFFRCFRFFCLFLSLFSVTKRILNFFIHHPDSFFFSIVFNISNSHRYIFLCRRSLFFLWRNLFLCWRTRLLYNSFAVMVMSKL